MLILFVLFILLLSWFTYAFICKLIKPKIPTFTSLVGKQVKVLSPIGPTRFDSGEIKIHGDTFPAVTEDELYIPKGSLVYINSLQGVRVIVSPTKNS